MATSGYKLFGQLLVERGVITAEQLDSALHKQRAGKRHRKLGEILVETGRIGKNHVTEELSAQLGLPIVKLSEREIPGHIRALVSGSIAMVYRVVPIALEEGTVVVATADPTNMTALDNLPRLLDRPVSFAIASSEEISSALAMYYGYSETTAGTILRETETEVVSQKLGTIPVSVLQDDTGISEISLGEMDFEDDESSCGDADDTAGVVSRYVHDVILEAFRLRASDIHIEPARADVKIRYRIDGVLHETQPLPKRAQAAVISRLKIKAGMDIAKKRIPQDGRIRLDVGARIIDLRVSALPGVHGESIVMRILDKSSLTLGLGELGFSTEDRQNWERLMQRANGVVLVTGPTGSGKTTTLYASLHTLNQAGVKLITVEDPVEYQLAGINQVQTSGDIGWSFSSALRAIFRQDPDVVMVGEIRDKETAEIAIKAALTGHLVLSTLHTNDSASAFVRLIDIGIKPFLVASGVAAILAQRLVRTICTKCKEPCKPREGELEMLGLNGVEPDGIELFHGAGCENCSHTGYSGRVGVYELFQPDDIIRKMIIDGASAGALRRQARLSGMKTMREDAWAKALMGITTIEEVYRKTRADEPLKPRSRPNAQSAESALAANLAYFGVPRISWPL
jgi:type II secretory ATPase GspE/PulE/Tfp pilus assembly ATPase PilB-like protein